MINKPYKKSLIIVLCLFLSLISCGAVNDFSEDTPESSRDFPHFTFNIPDNTVIIAPSTPPAVDFDYTLPTYEIDDVLYPCYILNIKTKKYHLATCSYLPEKENIKEIPKSSIYKYSEYSPCKHCLG